MSDAYSTYYCSESSLSISVVPLQSALMGISYLAAPCLDRSWVLHCCSVHLSVLIRRDEMLSEPLSVPPCYRLHVPPCPHHYVIHSGSNVQWSRWLWDNRIRLWLCYWYVTYRSLWDEIRVIKGHINIMLVNVGEAVYHIILNSDDVTSILSLANIRNIFCLRLSRLESEFLSYREPVMRIVTEQMNPISLPRLPQPHSYYYMVFQNRLLALWANRSIGVKWYSNGIELIGTEETSSVVQCSKFIKWFW